MEFALPDLAGFVSACLLLLLACALILLGYLIANTFGRLPVVGSWVTAHIVASLQDAANAVLAAADATWHFAVGMFNFLADVFLKPYIYTVHFAISAWGWLQHLANVTIPDAEARAASYALGLYQAGAADLTAVTSALRADLTADYAQLEARVNALYASALGASASAEAQAINVARGLVGTTVTDLDTAADAAVQIAWPDWAGDIGALRQTLGADFPWLSDLTGALAGAGAAGIMGLLIRAIASAHAVTDLANDCTIPNCRNLSGLGNDLANLAAMIGTGAMWAWVAFGITDPNGWAQDTWDVLGAPGYGAVNALVELVWPGHTITQPAA